MAISAKNLLPKKGADGDAPTQHLFNIKPRFTGKNIFQFRRLKNILVRISLIGMLAVYLMGYYPVFKFPPIARNQVHAAEEETHQIVADALPVAMSLPHSGYISTHFSYWHPGIDIATGLGMPIHPVAIGTVKEVYYDFWGYGHHVIISHPGGYESLYGHMGKIFVKVGESVTPDNIIGEVGVTGHTTGPHTHLEITKNGKYIDPLSVLPQLPDYPPKVSPKPVGGNEQTLLPDLNLNLHNELKPDFS